MSDDDFLVCFPCYCPMRSPDVPRRFIEEGDHCLVICTDRALADEFCARHPNPGGVNFIERFETEGQLASFLKHHAKAASGQPLFTHVVVDPYTPGTRVKTSTIGGMIALLWQQRNSQQASDGS